MQKGFATLEIILVTIIIAVLMKIAVPKAAQLIDTVSLDYEQKRFYSELRYVQAMSKSSKIYVTGTGDTKIISDTGTQPILSINADKNYYQVLKNSKKLREPHYLSNGVKINLYSESTAIIKINFDSEGKASINDRKSDSIILTSRLGKKKYIIFDSVGRIRGSLQSYDN